MNLIKGFLFLALTVHLTSRASAKEAGYAPVTGSELLNLRCDGNRIHTQILSLAKYSETGNTQFSAYGMTPAVCTLLIESLKNRGLQQVKLKKEKSTIKIVGETKYVPSQRGEGQYQRKTTYLPAEKLIFDYQGIEFIGEKETGEPGEEYLNIWSEDDCAPEVPYCNGEY